MADDNDDGGFDLDALIDQKINDRAEAERKKRERNKQPKDFGDFLDAVADAVLDRAEARAEERRKATEEADEPPSRGRGQTAFSKFWNGDQEQAS
jgi:hypothetical protein